MTYLRLVMKYVNLYYFSCFGLVIAYLIFDSEHVLGDSLSSLFVSERA